MNEEIITPEIEILTYLNQLADKNCRMIKSNLSPIRARLKDGYTVEELKEIIQVKTLEWKNNEVMNTHLHPTTLFQPSKVDKYLNQLSSIKANPEKYAKYFADLNKIQRSAADDAGDLAAMFGD